MYYIMYQVVVQSWRRLLVLNSVDISLPLRPSFFLQTSDKRKLDYKYRLVTGGGTWPAASGMYYGSSNLTYLL